MESTGAITTRAEREAAAAGDARAVAWWVLVGTAAGALAGLLVGGVGGRLAMLLLRLTSPADVLGMTSDDGFEIGVVTADTLNLVGATTAIGAVNGLLYAALRGWLPRRWRLPLWTAVSAAVMGALVVHDGGVDFTLLAPVSLAVALFVVLPAAAAALVVLLVERWADREPFADRRLAVALGGVALSGTVALLPAVLAWFAAVVGRRTGAGRVVLPLARVVVPLGVAAVALVAGVDLVREASRVI